MDVEIRNTQKIGFSPWKQSFSAPALEKLKAWVVRPSRIVKKIGEDDPRRMVHSLKVGLALTLVSIFYYVQPLFNGFGASSVMSAVLTVVIVMEYTVGGTLSKAFNRILPTLVAGALGVGAHHIAVLVGEKGEPVLLGFFVFLLASAATFSRFIPEIKARYDYGMVVIILTFTFVTVSSYRVDEIIKMAHHRLSTVAMGTATCIFTSIFVFPVWAGEDLHNMVAGDLEKLASFLEGLGREYFRDKAEGECLEGWSFLQAYKSVLNSNSTEESLANLARWEPGHGSFAMGHPWKQYLKIGAQSRQCAYFLEALGSYITTFGRNQELSNLEVNGKIITTCVEMSMESSMALMELASAIRSMTAPFTAKHHLAMAISAVNKVKTSLSKDHVLSEVQQPAVVAFLIIQIVQCVDQVMVSVEELAQLACFKNSEETHRATIKRPTDSESPSIAILVDK